MKLDYQIKRRLKCCIEDLSKEFIESYFQINNLPFSNNSNSVVDVIDKAVDGNWDRKLFDRIWKLAELSSFMNKWLTFRKVKKSDAFIKEIRQYLKTSYLLSDLIILQIHTAPKIFLLSKLPKSFKSNIEKAKVNSLKRDSIYWIPEYGLVLLDYFDDEVGNNFIEKCKQMIGPFETKRIRALDLKKIYNNEVEITKLSVKAEAQITGFDGLHKISFVGDHVKKGIYGLHKRQDIRVHLDGIGPKIEVELPSLSLKIGEKVLIKEIDGLFKLSEIIHPTK